jgi:hypothetical protein
MRSLQSPSRRAPRDAAASPLSPIAPTNSNASTTSTDGRTPTDGDVVDVLNEIYGVVPSAPASCCDDGPTTALAARQCEHPTLARMLASFKDVLLGTECDLATYPLYPPPSPRSFMICNRYVFSFIRAVSQ